MKKQFAAAAAALTFIAAPLPALAGGSIQASLIVNGEVDFDDAGSADYDGFALKGSVDVTDMVFVFAAADFRSLDDADLDQTQSRLGVGLKGHSNQVTYWGGIDVETFNVDFGFDEEKAVGLGFRAGLSAALSQQFSVYGELGISSLEYDDSEETDLSIVDFLIGAVFLATENVGLFADFRLQQASEDYGSFEADYDLSDLRIGAAYFF